MPVQFDRGTLCVRGANGSSPAIRTTEPVLIHWPAVAAAGTLALLLVAGFTLAAWLVGRSTGVGRDQALIRGETNKLATTDELVQPAQRISAELAQPDRVEPSEIQGAGSLDPALHKAALDYLDGAVSSSPVITDEGLAFVCRPLTDPTGHTQVSDRCETFGTHVRFVRTPTEAATLAQRDRKLVFLPQISGNFEDQRFT